MFWSIHIDKLSQLERRTIFRVFNIALFTLKGVFDVGATVGNARLAANKRDKDYSTLVTWELPLSR